MINVSETKNTAPSVFGSDLQEKVYRMLDTLAVPFERVESDEVITMEDCKTVNEKLNMKMVKTLFLCNRQKTVFYLFVTPGDKSFSSKNFSDAMGTARVSFAPAELIETMLGTKLGAVTVFSALTDIDKEITVVLDKDVLAEEYYGCSDGLTTSYMKLKTDDVLNKILPFTDHRPTIIEV